MNCGRRMVAVAVLAHALAGSVLLQGAEAAPPAAAVADTPATTWGANGAVYAVAISGSVAYFGGSFDYVGPFTGSLAGFAAFFFFVAGIDPKPSWKFWFGKPGNQYDGKGWRFNSWQRVGMTSPKEMRQSPNIRD